MKKTSLKTFEKDNSTGKNHEGAHPNMPLKFLTASSIIGDEILNKEGDKLGEINDIMFDLSSGKTEYMVIEMGGFLGLGEKYFAIPFKLLKVDSKQEVFILDQTKEALHAAPGFDKDHWPETNTHEFDNSSTYWGGFMGANTGGVPY
jgi:sporulation protein YlmC with PRC-barrel domain